MAYRDAAARDAARIAAEVEVGAVEVLDRHTERPGRLGDGGQGLQNLQQVGPAYHSAVLSPLTPETGMAKGVGRPAASAKAR